MPGGLRQEDGPQQQNPKQGISRVADEGIPDLERDEQIETQARHQARSIPDDQEEAGGPGQPEQERLDDGVVREQKGLEQRRVAEQVPGIGQGEHTA